MVVKVLRLGHRRMRDKRVSTHCGLVARAFGAGGIVYSGEKDDKLIGSIRKVVGNWGGDFEVSYVKNWRKFLKDFEGVIVHLTMYGLPFEKEIKNVKKKSKGQNVLVVIGAEKVPGEVYHSADFNLSVSNQPHSEIAALALFLDRFFGGKEFGKKFNGKIMIEPCKEGKRIVEK